MPGYDLYTVVQMFIKLVIAALCGGILGLSQRSLSERVGFYTLMVITLGSTLFTVVSFGIASRSIVLLEQLAESTLIIAIGVLGAGAFINRRGHSGALQLGSGIWLSGAVGMAVGAGYYFPAILITLVGYLLLDRIFIDKEG